LDHENAVGNCRGVLGFSGLFHQLTGIAECEGAELASASFEGVGARRNLAKPACCHVVRHGPRALVRELDERLEHEGQHLVAPHATEQFERRLGVVGNLRHLKSLGVKAGKREARPRRSIPALSGFAPRARDKCLI